MFYYDADKIFTFLKGFYKGAGMNSSLRALIFARAVHEGQFRADGQPFLVHPLFMASYLISMKVYDDDLSSIVLLHDVNEDRGVEIDTLPFNKIIREGVRYMTFRQHDNEDKESAKERYYRELLLSREALMCKAVDRFMNLASMEGVLSKEAVENNIIETDTLLLPVLREGREKWPEIADYLFVMRANLRAVMETLAWVHGIELRECGKRGVRLCG
ncbi:MAG: bifunctional (p)ppGpp synthetase/guanosine-3',5'-bis(diphosphate) 3'-pyrophosphohydrolase [Stomatobaculum sp.]|nr:bifunctional (p)ppGpp synthetase/guanosine-3',5'-bis(diphosphate) 3'-pyrophosphohydrolase [Stomatobaculum sp.]